MTAVSNPLRVGFVFHNDGNDWHGGLNYFRSLFLALQSLPDPRVRPVAFVGERSDVAGYGFPANVEVVRDALFDLRGPRHFANRVANRLFGVPLVANRALRRHGIQVLSHAMPSGDRKLPSIGWIPDFQHVHLPQLFEAADLAQRDRVYGRIVSRSDRLIASSQAVLADLESFAPGAARKARVLRFCAVRPDLQATAGLDLREAYGIDGPYVYIPNQAWVHKNHLVAIRALGLLREAHPELTIVCTGSLSDYRNPGHAQALRDEIARQGLGDRFRMLGLVPYAHIARLMLHSVAVINPSLFEGWSTPVEEAKALGVPLVLSGIAVHREQCQDGEATFFDPHEPQQLADCLRASLAAWQARPGRDVQGSLVRHRARTEAFARTYEDIVAELVDGADAAR